MEHDIETGVDKGVLYCLPLFRKECRNGQNMETPIEFGII